MRNKTAVVTFLVLLAPVFLNATPLESLASKLMKGVHSLKEKKVAVLTLPYHDGKMSSGSSIISERLTTMLVKNGKIQVVERRLLQSVLSEKKLSETGAIDPTGIKEIGSVLGVDAVVTGTLIDFEDGRTEINARMIKIDSGEILAAAQETIDRTWKDRPYFPLPPQREEAKPAPQANLTPTLPERTVVEPEHRKPEPSKDEAKLTESESMQQETIRKNEIKFSNESFPPGRRRYLSNDPGPRRNTGRKPTYSSYESTQSSDVSYEDGYSDGHRQAVNDYYSHPSDSYATKTDPTFAPTHFKHQSSNYR